MAGITNAHFLQQTYIFEASLIMHNVCAKGKKTRGNKCILIGKEDKLKSYSTDQNGTGKTTGAAYTASGSKRDA